MKKSESIAKLAVALVKFNQSVEKIAKDKKNPHFKNNYATVDQIIESVRPQLAENGLSILQFPAGDENGNVIMTTMLLHESGEWLESDPLVMKPVKSDPQAVGSCITYARRYSLAAILSLNTGEDDDANMASGRTPQSARQPQHVTQDVSHATYSEHEQIPDVDGHVVEIPEQEAPAIIKQLWQIKHGSLDKLHDFYNKQRKLGYSDKNITANLTKEIRVPDSIGDLWAGMYIDNAETMKKLQPWYISKRIEGMTVEQIETQLAEAMTKKQTAAAGA